MLVAALSLGCGSSQSTSPAAQGDAKLPESPVSRYLPLIDGTIWAYDAEDDETGNRGMFVTKARRLPGPRFSLTSGQSAHIVEVRSDGLAHADTKNYVLKAPLSAGAQWPGERGSVVRVSAVDRVVEVPAGKFVGCIDTIEELPAPAGKDPLRRVTATYCPDVGIVLLHAEAWQNGRHAGERATLRSFGKPIQIQ
ncbi:MAG TPA: hypothetical protein VF881_00440 [Polyangiaceae bacterium]